jgi:hypothetical protein
MPSYEDENDSRNDERDALLRRMAALPSLDKESIARDARDDYRQALILRMRNRGSAPFTDKEWDIVGRLWAITKGGIADEEHDALEKWWDEEVAKLCGD